MTITKTKGVIVRRGYPICLECKGIMKLYMLIGYKCRKCGAWKYFPTIERAIQSLSKERRKEWRR